MDGIQWIADSLDAYCVSFGKGLTISQLATALGASSEAIIPAVTGEDAFSLAMTRGPVARLGVCAGWAFAIEEWSDVGIGHGTLSRTSRVTEGVAVMRTGTSPQHFVYAEGGEIVANFEPGVPVSQFGGTDPTRLVPALQEVELITPDESGTSHLDTDRRILDMAERFYGLSLPRAKIENGTLPAALL